MKPLKLVINAFGPYIDKTEIDFTQLGENGLYLITGETGAGKTTVFDALSFALFGQASGSVRSNSQSLRSDFAKENNITYVDLEFLSGGEKYFIHRECAYKKINRNGNISNVTEKAELRKPNGTGIASLSEVNEEINNILGIDKNQFSQIVMIAQGEFQRFLLAPTKEKEKIFRKIFKTYFYQDFQTKLSEMFKEKEGEKKNILLLLKKDIENINPNNDILEELIKNENAVYNLDELLETLEASLKDDENENTVFKTKSENIKKEVEKLIKEIEKAKTINQYIKDLAEINEKLPEYETRKAETEKLFLAEKDKEKDRNKINTDIQILETSLKEYEELETKQNELTQNNTKLKTSEELLKIRNEKMETLENDHKNNIQELDKLKNIPVDIEKNKTAIDKNAEEKEKLEEIQKKISEYRDKNDEYLKQKELSENALKEYQDKREVADNLYKQFIANQAGNLAKDLKDGEKCPVCGSTEHPQLAKLPKTAVSDEDIKAANEARDTAQTNNTNETKKLTELYSEVKTAEKELLKFGEKQFGLKVIEGLEENIEKALADNSIKAKELSEQKAILEKNDIRKKSLEESVKGYDELKSKLGKEIQTEEKNVADLKSEISGIEATIKEKLKNLKYKTKNEAQDVLNSEKDKLQKLKEAFAKAEEAKNTAESELSKEKGRKAELEKKIPKDFNVDSDKLDKEYTDKQNLLNEMQENNKGLFSRMNNNKTVLDSIKKLKKQFEKISNEVDMLDNLSRTANGQLTGGKQKISFENYVLGTYFNEIIHAANQRFKDMTAGQFELKKADAKSGNAQTGLDLDVFDSYTGKARSVTSLSGGESFKAALALSLGLSDIIQQQSGGIQIETMFIDEGFGSLDQESLEQTMKTLYELSGNNTLIGIISHVETLRERIEKKIVVKKTPSGSKLEILL